MQDFNLLKPIPQLRGWERSRWPPTARLPSVTVFVVPEVHSRHTTERYRCLCVFSWRFKVSHVAKAAIPQTIC